MGETIENLEVIFKNVDDITDPSSMDKVLMILDEMRIADEEYMELLVEKLRSEVITWPQPWYQKSTCLTRKPKASADQSETYKMDSFTLKECQRVEKNWKKFVKQYEVPDTPVCLARWRNRDKARNASNSVEEFVRCFVIAYLAKRLKRDLYQVNRFFLQYAYPIKRNQYTPVEEKIMEICFYQNPANAVKIVSSVLGREPRGIYKRLFKYYNGEPEKKRLKWTLELATKLLNGLILYSGYSLEELKNKEIDQSVWIKLEEEMEQKYCYLRSFWYTMLHVQLFTQYSVKNKTLREIICKHLENSTYKIWSDIRWRDLVQKFPDGITAGFMHRQARHTFRKIPKYLTRPLPEVVAEAIEVNRRTKRCRRLKCVEFDGEGNLQYVKRERDLQEVMFDKSDYKE